eukprot:scaffold23363_cov180-Skeletonema_marinoi.AAC.4
METFRKFRPQRYELRQQTLDALIKGLPRCSHLRHCTKWYRKSGGVHGHRQNIHGREPKVTTKAITIKESQR